MVCYSHETRAILQKQASDIDSTLLAPEKTKGARHDRALKMLQFILVKFGLSRETVHLLIASSHLRNNDMRRLSPSRADMRDVNIIADVSHGAGRLVNGAHSPRPHVIGAAVPDKLKSCHRELDTVGAW